MADKRFQLVATVSTDNLGAIRPVFEGFIGRFCSFQEVSKGEYLIQAAIGGTSAKDLNRSLLSALDKAEKPTRLRAEWNSGSTTEHYFDYVLKKTTIPRRVLFTSPIWQSR